MSGERAMDDQQLKVPYASLCKVRSYGVSRTYVTIYYIQMSEHIQTKFNVNNYVCTILNFVE